jgi:hypothetical protein
MHDCGARRPGLASARAGEHGNRAGLRLAHRYRPPGLRSNTGRSDIQRQFHLCTAEEQSDSLLPFWVRFDPALRRFAQHQIISNRNPIAAFLAGFRINCFAISGL